MRVRNITTTKIPNLVIRLMHKQVRAQNNIIKLTSTLMRMQHVSVIEIPIESTEAQKHLEMQTCHSNMCVCHSLLS